MSCSGSSVAKARKEPTAAWMERGGMAEVIKFQLVHHPRLGMMLPVLEADHGQQPAPGFSISFSSGRHNRARETSAIAIVL